jgi:hypothetical protein
LVCDLRHVQSDRQHESGDGEKFAEAINRTTKPSGMNCLHGPPPASDTPMAPRITPTQSNEATAKPVAGLRLRGACAKAVRLARTTAICRQMKATMLATRWTVPPALGPS